MKYFIGIVPREEYKTRITEFRDKWKNNSISDIVEPHITLKAQGGLTQDEKWISIVKEICYKTSPFQITLAKPMFFGEEILYLSTTSKELYTLHERILRKVAPPSDLIEKYFELDNYVPHLTIGKTAYGLTKQELINMANLAEIELAPFPTFEVTSVRIYQESAPNRYIKYLDIPLNEDK
ncbi:2'-5' RNA ligase family protein [Sutcliffiella horikoshii]|uniref:2'-5' RNA ligase family protein n=1 Tax=Sutcliffiella horikoshii TaxID=79883 RepID=A0A5D4T457_9BACI|nr:2'-5' RNA ligase family protein [Sutcliffiella horikoshii]TYS70487.1 2'-5' RNA ligase family protein [Sutcliffiella horikoshii]